MKNRTIWGLLTVSALLASIIVCSYKVTAEHKGLTDQASQRSLADIQNDPIIYLDDKALAGAADSSTDAALKSKAIEAYALVNEVREAAGKEDLTWDPNLESAADVRASESSRSFSHTRPNGDPWYTVDSSIQGGENLAFGQDTAMQVVNDWIESPTHFENIVYDDFTSCAVSLYQDNYSVNYWALEFGY